MYGSLDPDVGVSTGVLWEKGRTGPDPVSLSNTLPSSTKTLRVSPGLTGPDGSRNVTIPSHPLFTEEGRVDFSIRVVRV